jgi:hypothetical protein
MVIGHFAIADLIIAANPGVPALPIFIAVNYPDILWPFLLLAKKEKVAFNPHSALQKETKFLHYPYSHSLVLSGILTLIPSLLFGFIYHSFLVAALFWIGALSHWLLDLIVHVPDLPVLGFGRDKKVGFGLWKNGPAAFFVELLFYLIVILFTAPHRMMLPLLAVGIVLHLFNANAFFGFSKKNMLTSPKQVAISALVLFAIVIAINVAIWQL